MVAGDRTHVSFLPLSLSQAICLCLSAVLSGSFLGSLCLSLSLSLVVCLSAVCLVPWLRWIGASARCLTVELSREHQQTRPVLFLNELPCFLFFSLSLHFSSRGDQLSCTSASGGHGHRHERGPLFFLAPTSFAISRNHFFVPLALSVSADDVTTQVSKVRVLSRIVARAPTSRSAVHVGFGEGRRGGPPISARFDPTDSCLSKSFCACF